MINILQTLNNCQEKITTLTTTLPLDQFSKRISEIDELSNKTNIWSDPQKAASLMKERQKLTETIDQLSSLVDRVKTNIELVQAFPEEENLLSNDVIILEQEVEMLEMKYLLSDPLDKEPALLFINAGAGGLEAANWVSMLLRMYLRYAANHNFTVEILDQKPSEEHSSICTDSVSLRIEGKNAYGFLKGENGVHRLIRNSPFNANDARQTSFAAVQVLPDIEDSIEIKINDNDLEITAQTSGGPGGQSVNKTASACRAKHLPSGIMVLVRTQRDFHSNKKTALKMIKAKLYDLEVKKKKEEDDKYLSSLSENSFGAQIRTYYINPYSLCKDHRTKFEIQDVNSVLDGSLQEIIITYLKFLVVNNVLCL